MLQFSCPPQSRFPLTIEEAVRRISDKAEIESMFQPDAGSVTKMYKANRLEMEFLLKSSPLIEEAGIVGQRMNMGVMFFIRHPKLGPGWMFVETKPEERIPDDKILERDRLYAMSLMADKLSQSETNSEVN